MTNDTYRLDALAASAIPATLPAGVVEHGGHTELADALPKEDRYVRLVQEKYRGVRIGAFGFVLEPAALYEIVESARISPLPGVTSLCKGLINHRSNVVPVYDVTELAGVKQPVWERKRLLILNARENAVGLLLYDLPAQIGVDNPVQADGITDVPEIFHRHASGAYLSNGTLWLCLNRDSFFTELNTLCIRVA
jgi:chemotaxis signal transduction protein